LFTPKFANENCIQAKESYPTTSKIHEAKKARSVSNFENHKYLQYFYKICMILFKNKLWKGKVWWYQHQNSKPRLQKYLLYLKVKRNIRLPYFKYMRQNWKAKHPPIIRNLSAISNFLKYKNKR